MIRLLRGSVSSATEAAGVHFAKIRKVKNCQGQVVDWIFCFTQQRRIDSMIRNGDHLTLAKLKANNESRMAVRSLSDGNG